MQSNNISFRLIRINRCNEYKKKNSSEQTHTLIYEELCLFEIHSSGVNVMNRPVDFRGPENYRFVLKG